MSAVFGDLPRKPLSDAELAENNRNRIDAQHAMALYSSGEARLRKEIEEKLGVVFELDDDDGNWYVDEKRLEGEYDFERFTPEDWDMFRLYRYIADQVIERTRVLEALPFARQRGVLATKFTRWMQR